MAGREYARDKNGKFASKGSGAKSAAGKAASAATPTRGGNLTKRIQLRDAVGQERRKLMRESTLKKADQTGKKLKQLRDFHRQEAKKLPVLRKPKP